MYIEDENEKEDENENKTLNDKSLIALRAQNYEHSTSDHILEGLEDVLAENMEKLENYFSNFLTPRENCVLCGESLLGLLGSFTWGLAHGEGFCYKCGYPARAYHRDVAGVIDFLNLILQYHPDALETKAERMEREEKEEREEREEKEEEGKENVQS